MEGLNSLLQPLLQLPATAASSPPPPPPPSHHIINSSNNNKDLIIIRLVFIFSIAAISLWANHEASKSFHITLLNPAATADSPAGRRFALSYISNDKATRIILNTSSFVEHFLYPDPQKYPKKHINHVTLRLASRNLTATVIVSAEEKVNDYVIDLSPTLLEEEDHKEKVVSSILRAMVRVWLWDGGSKHGAPARIIDGMVEYVVGVAGFSPEGISGAGEGLPELCDDWWVDKEPRHVAKLLHFCEVEKEGFIRRLNQGMRDTWHDGIVDNALGFSRRKLCGLRNSSWAPQNNTMLVGGL